MLTSSSEVVIVGASAAGLTAAETLRRHGCEGALTLVGDEARPPYDRPPLFKHVWRGDWPVDKTLLMPSDALAAFDA